MVQETQYKVLIVDDNRAMADDVGETLSFTGTRNYKSLIAENGTEASSLYQSNPDLALILLDTDLINEKGYDVLDKLRKEGYDGPALAWSARDHTTDWKTRNVEFVDKSIRPENLERTIRDLIDNYKK